MNRELLLLGLIRQADMHGYKIIEFIERDLSMCTDLKKPTAYFMLDKMAQNGWISAHLSVRWRGSEVRTRARNNLFGDRVLVFLGLSTLAAGLLLIAFTLSQPPPGITKPF